MKRQRVLFMFFIVAALLFCYCALSYAATIDVESSGQYPTIQDGYEHTANGDTIQVQAGTYAENDIFDNNISVTLLGGFNSSFSANSSYSTIYGTLIISNGTVTVGNIIISPPPTLASIAVISANSSIPVGATDQFTAIGTYSNNSAQNITASVTWSSSNTSVATISSGGDATAAAAGNTTITATLGSISGSAALTVNPPALVSIAVTAPNSSIAVGATDQFTATGTYSDGSTKNLTTLVTWSSSNTSVATIASSGIVTAKAAGTTTITAASGNISGSAGLTVTGGGSGSGVNVLTLTVNGSTCDSSIGPYQNEPCVSVTVCTPGASTCQTINGILLDTGSYGLRLFKQTLGNVSPTQVTSGSGSLAECVQYADGSSDWGPVQIADVILGNEQAVQVPVQVINSTFPTAAIANNVCPGSDTQPSDTGFNGILGVGPFIQDCGTTCATSIVGQYYTCSGSNCSGTTVPLSKQVVNPVALTADSNGLIVQLPTVAAGGAVSVAGSLVLGIGTESNNSPSVVTTYTLDSSGDFTTTFNSTTYTSFIDTGSNGLFFQSPSRRQLPNCPDNSGFFCPSSTQSFSATIEGASGSQSGIVSFEIGDFDTLINSPNMVFSDIGGTFTGEFDWGLPFYFGKNVFIGFEGETSILGAGPYFAY